LDFSRKIASQAQCPAIQNPEVIWKIDIWQKVDDLDNLKFDYSRHPPYSPDLDPWSF
jgi:hypothetical protein